MITRFIFHDFACPADLNIDRVAFPYWKMGAHIERKKLWPNLRKPGPNSRKIDNIKKEGNNERSTVARKAKQRNSST